jgi:chorismate-pyruvate lyase
VPRKDEPGIENQVKTLSDQVKLISEKLGRFTPNEKKSLLLDKKKNTTNKQVWIKKEDNLCLVAHTTLKILGTCLWYLDSG